MSRRKANETAAMRVFAAYATLTQAEAAEFELMRHGPWKTGRRKDGSMWLSLGDPAKGPHYQGDLCASDVDARCIVNARELYEVVDAFRLAAAMDKDLHPAWRVIYNAAVDVVNKVKGATA